MLVILSFRLNFHITHKLFKFHKSAAKLLAYPEYYYDYYYFDIECSEFGLNSV